MNTRLSPTSTSLQRTQTAILVMLKSLGKALQPLHTGFQNTQPPLKYWRILSVTRLLLLALCSSFWGFCSSSWLGDYIEPIEPVWLPWTKLPLQDAIRFSATCILLCFAFVWILNFNFWAIFLISSILIPNKIISHRCSAKKWCCFQYPQQASTEKQKL